MLFLKLLIRKLTIFIQHIQQRPLIILNAMALWGLLVIFVLPSQAGENNPALPETQDRSSRQESGHIETEEARTGHWRYGAYLDLGYTVSFNDPGNGLWRSKSTTFEVDKPKVNMAMGYVRKEALPESRWGLEFGVQGGVDVKGLAPDDNEAISGADFWRHLYRANLSYLFAVGNGIQVTGGLINSHIAYESYHAIENPNYTRGYITDFVPYFFFGANNSSYPVSDTIDLAFYAVSGWNYLTNPNDTPSLSMQMNWKRSKKVTFTQNIYYGPDQEDTAIKYWRFFSDSILEWNCDPFLLALSFDFGVEKQAEQMGNPRYYWLAGALWAKWQISDPLSLAFRPEFYYDPDGLSTGAEQFIQAYTATLKYTINPFAQHTIAACLEYRYDRSTGSDGGFYEGSDNHLVPNQHLVMFALMWSFGK